MSKIIELELYDIDKEMMTKWINDDHETRVYFFKQLITNRMIVNNVLFLGNEYDSKGFMKTTGYMFYNFAHRLIFTIMVEQCEEFLEKGKLIIEGRKPIDSENDLIQYWFGKLFL